MRTTIAVAAVLYSALALASVPIRTTLKELAEGADHILIGRVVGVDMIDEKGRPITDEHARTGPGLTNTIRLHIAVDGVLRTNAKDVPKLLRVPLDPFMHYSLGQIKNAHAKPSEPYLVLLKSTSYLPVVRGAFLRTLDEKEAALRFHAEKGRDPKAAEKRKRAKE